jgi:hypothetical protein
MPQAGTGAQYGMLPTQPYFQMPMPETASVVATAPEVPAGLGGLNLKTLVLLGAGAALVWYIMKQQKKRG